MSPAPMATLRLRAMDIHRRANVPDPPPPGDETMEDGFRHEGEVPQVTPKSWSSVVEYQYNDSLALDNTKWYYLTKEAFDKAPRGVKRCWHHVGRMLFTDDAVPAEEPCTRCLANNEVCKVYSVEAQNNRQQIARLPIRCAHCILSNVQCFSEREIRGRRERANGDAEEAGQLDADSANSVDPDAPRQPRTQASKPNYSLKELTKNAGAYRYAEMHPPPPKKRGKKPRPAIQAGGGNAPQAVMYSQTMDSDDNFAGSVSAVASKMTTASGPRASVSDLTETREKACSILSRWEIPLAEKDDPIKILLRQPDWFPRAKAEGWYHRGTTKVGQMRKIKAVKALQKQIKADEEAQRRMRREQKRTEKAEVAAQKEAQRSQVAMHPTVLPSQPAQPMPIMAPSPWSEIPPPWAFPEWLSQGAPVAPPYNPVHAPPPMQPPMQPPSRKRKNPEDSTGNKRSYVRMKPLRWQYPKVPLATLFTYLLSPGARTLLPENPATISYISTPNPFTLLLASTLLSRPGIKPNTAHAQIHNALNVLLKPPYSFTSALSLQNAGEQPLQQALAEAKQVHRQKIIEDVTKLIKRVQADLATLDDAEGTQISRLRSQGGENGNVNHKTAFLEGVLPCLNPVGFEAFFRRIQLFWPEHFPHVSQYAADSLKKLGLPQTANELLAMIDNHWAEIGQWEWIGADERQWKRRAFVVLLERAATSNYADNAWEVMTAANGGGESAVTAYRKSHGSGEDSLADLLRSEATQGPSMGT